jgi:cell division septum initiation protein DivIVA
VRDLQEENEDLKEENAEMDAEIKHLNDMLNEVENEKKSARPVDKILDVFKTEESFGMDVTTGDGHFSFTPNVAPVAKPVATPMKNTIPRTPAPKSSRKARREARGMRSPLSPPTPGSIQ